MPVTSAVTPSCTWQRETDTQVCPVVAPRLGCTGRDAHETRHYLETLEYLLHHISPALISAKNDAKSTPLHWAALNAHLPVAQALVKCPRGPGVDLIDIKNEAGRTPLGEAENVGWEEGAKWFVEVMNLDESAKGEELQVAENTDKIEVEIQDAEGQVAKMTNGQRPTAPPSDPPNAQ